MQASLYACKKLLTDDEHNLQHYLDQNNGDWVKAVKAAKAEFKSLVAIGWNRGQWDKKKEGTNISTYCVYGACVSEVLLDVLTGDLRIERVDLMMDLGNQLDAAVDIGQIQGGFVQALGYLFTEKMEWNADGQNMNLGTWEYKIPSAYDIPVEFNVSLLEGSPNPNGVKGSKAVAEPVMHLVGSPYLAVKNAIYAARETLYGEEEGCQWFPMNVPLGIQEIRKCIGSEEQLQDKLLLPQ